MGLDFSALDSIGIHNEHDAQTIHPIQPTAITERERADPERAAAAGREAAQRTAAATVASKQGRTAILKGLAAGADIYALFLFACSGLAELTGDADFRDQAGELVRIVYDEVQELIPLPVLLDGIHLRTRRLENYLSRPDISPEARATAERALTAHRSEAEKIRQKILS